MFWLPLRKTILTALCIIPAAICAFGVPVFIADVHFRTPPVLPKVWAALPFGILMAELMWHIAVRAQHAGSSKVKSIMEMK